jgi:hypothetical protein
MSIVLSSSTLTDIVNTTGIGVQRKTVRGTTNYYFSPNMGLKLFKAQVYEATPKHIVFKYDIVNSSSLHSLLSYVNSTFKASVEPQIQKGKPFYDLFNFNGKHIYIRCHLPSKYGQIFVSSFSDDNEIPFKLPRPGAIFEEVLFDIRNVWETKEKAGFNLELKSVRV